MVAWVERARGFIWREIMPPAHPPRLDTVRSAVRSVCEHRPVARVELFGSVARGTPRVGSDVDLLVEFASQAKVGLLEMGALKEELEERLGCLVDLLSRPAVLQGRSAICRRAILANPLTIYARWKAGRLAARYAGLGERHWRLPAKKGCRLGSHRNVGRRGAVFLRPCGFS